MMRYLPFPLLILATVSSATAEPDAPGVAKIIPVEQTRKLKAIRDEIGEIKGLDE